MKKTRKIHASFLNSWLWNGLEEQMIKLKSRDRQMNWAYPAKTVPSSQIFSPPTFAALINLHVRHLLQSLLPLRCAVGVRLHQQLVIDKRKYTLQINEHNRTFCDKTSFTANPMCSSHSIHWTVGSTNHHFTTLPPQNILLTYMFNEKLS